MKKTFDVYWKWFRKNSAYFEHISVENSKPEKAKRKKGTGYLTIVGYLQQV